MIKFRSGVLLSTNFSQIFFLRAMFSKQPAVAAHSRISQRTIRQIFCLSISNWNSIVFGNWCNDGFFRSRGNIFSQRNAFADILPIRWTLLPAFPNGHFRFVAIAIYQPVLQTDSGYRFRHDNVGIYFTGFDSSQALFWRQIPKKVTLLRIPNGDGQFIFSSTPFIFTNYNMLLAENYRFIATALSFFRRHRCVLGRILQRTPPDVSNTDPFYSQPAGVEKRIFHYFCWAFCCLSFFRVAGNSASFRWSTRCKTLLWNLWILSAGCILTSVTTKNGAEKNQSFSGIFAENYRVNTAEITPELHETLARKTTRPLSEIENLFNFSPQSAIPDKSACRNCWNSTGWSNPAPLITESIQRTE